MLHGHCSNALHAEQNAILWAAREGVSLAGADVYITHAPCAVCHRMLRALGVSHVYYANAYRVVPEVEADHACLALVLPEGWAAFVASLDGLKGVP